MDDWRDTRDHEAILHDLRAQLRELSPFLSVRQRLAARWNLRVAGAAITARKVLRRIA